MITSLLFAVAAQTISRSPHGGFVSYGPGTPMGYSTPAFLSVASGAAYTVAPMATDTDLYKRIDMPYDFDLWPYSSDIRIVGSFGSGIAQEGWGWVNLGTDVNCMSRSWNVKAPMVGSDETLITYDYFIAQDTVSGNRRDADTPRFTTVVQVDG